MCGCVCRCHLVSCIIAQTALCRAWGCASWNNKYHVSDLSQVGCARTRSVESARRFPPDIPFSNFISETLTENRSWGNVRRLTCAADQFACVWGAFPACLKMRSAVLERGYTYKIHSSLSTCPNRSRRASALNYNGVCS